MSCISPPWHAEAIRMRSAEPRPSFVEIADALGRSVQAVRYACDENGEKVRQRAKDARKREQCRLGIIMPGNPRGYSSFVEFHKPRTIAQLLADRETKMAALREFAACRIPREEMMRRISV